MTEKKEANKHLGANRVTVERWIVGDTGKPEKFHVQLSADGLDAYYELSGGKSLRYDSIALGLTAKEALEKHTRVFKAWAVKDSWNRECSVIPVYLRLYRGVVRVYQESGYELRHGLSYNGRDQVFVNKHDALVAAQKVANSYWKEAVEAAESRAKCLQAITTALRRSSRRKAPPAEKANVHSWVVDKDETAKLAAKLKAKAATTPHTAPAKKA